MLLVLILLLTLMSISLRIAQAGIELSYLVDKRADAIRSKNSIKSNKDLLKEKSIRLVKSGSIAGLRVSIKVLRIIISWIRNLLCVAEGFVLVVDIFMLLFILSAVSFYLLLNG